MRFTLLIICLLLVSKNYSQTSNVGIGTSSPDPSAILELKSTDKGFLLPRLNNIERNSINNPSAGLMIFNVESQCINFYTGTSWVEQCGRAISNLLPNAVYVDHVSGSDSNSGSPAEPVQTINYAIQVAQTEAKDSIIIAAGLYEERITPNDGNILLGSYDRTSWTLIPAAYPVTRIHNTDQNDAISASLFMDSKTQISVKNMEFLGRNCINNCGTSYAIVVLNSQNILLDSINIITGNGRRGESGLYGQNGTNGTDGGDATTSMAGAGGGVSGGDGGENEGDGEAGINGSLGLNPGSGGAGGAGAPDNQSPEPGFYGGDGVNGSHGIGGSGFGSIISGYYQEAFSEHGSSGSDGGGGGGGGGGSIDLFNGGGGGSYGERGEYGEKGLSGEGSFGLWIYASTVTISNSIIQGGLGGDGGSGGVGGMGGIGGKGGISLYTCGPDGGKGGNGGNGGHGGGGGGGPSFCIYSSNGSQVTIQNVTLKVGLGGQAGLSLGNSGAAGLFGDKNF